MIPWFFAPWRLRVKMMIWITLFNARPFHFWQTFGKHDSAAVTRILEIAENRLTPDTPRECAWQKLAELYGVEWPLDATEEMILRPESEASERIRSNVHHAMAMDKNSEESFPTGILPNYWKM